MSTASQRPPSASPGWTGKGQGGELAAVYIGLGSNLGDREEHLDAALMMIASIDGVQFVTGSEMLETAPVGGPTGQGAFLNAVCRIETELAPGELLTCLQQIEESLGRDAPEDREHWGPREIDLDILLFGDQVVATDELTIPHPLMHERHFVLAPLCSIAPEATHPILNKSVSQMLDEIDNEPRT